MNDLTVLPDAPIQAEIKSVSTDDLKRELASQFELTARHVARLSLIWRELERRGEDLSAYRAGIGQYLSAVAYGRLLPAAVVRLAGNRPALRAFSMLSTDEQARLLEAGSVHVVRDDTSEEVPISRLSQSDISRAIDTVNGRVLPVSEQRAPARRNRSRQKLRRLVVMLPEHEYEAMQSLANRTKRSMTALAVETLRDGGVLK